MNHDSRAGRLYKQVPKELHQNLLFRRHLLEEANSSTKKAQALIAGCAEDLLFYVNTCGWIYEPRDPEEKWKPFITYPFQDEILLDLEELLMDRKSGVFLKSRDMGLSWIFCVFIEHTARFREHSKIGLLSRTEDEVDSQDSDSLFWKIMKFQEMLPPWFQENSPEKNGATLTFPVSKSIISGKANTEATFVGGRATMLLCDEISRYEPKKCETLLGGIYDVSDTIFFNFTVNPTIGKQHPSYRLVEQGQRGDIFYKTVHWSKHPEKARGLYKVDKRTKKVETLDPDYDYSKTEFQLDGVFELHSEWFDSERKRRNNDKYVQTNMELDFDQAGYGFFDHDFIFNYAMKYARPAPWQGDISVDENGNFISFIPNKNGAVRFWVDPTSLPPTQYVVGCDLSLGLGKTNSVASGARTDIGEKIMEFATPFLRPDVFALYVVALCRLLSNRQYNCLLGWEQQGPGETFAKEVERIGYQHLFIDTETTSFKSGVVRPGWYNSKGASHLLLTGYNAALGQGTFVNHSREALDECLQWVHTPKGPRHKATTNITSKSITDPSGASENHGDRVMADAITCKLSLQKKVAPVDIRPVFFDIFAEDVSARKLYPDWQHGRRR